MCASRAEKERSLTTRLCRPASHWRGQEQYAVEPANKAVHCAFGDEGRGAGYEERGSAVQSAGDGTRCLRSGCSVDTHRLAGKHRRCITNGTPNRISCTCTGACTCTWALVSAQCIRCRGLPVPGHSVALEAVFVLLRFQGPERPLPGQICLYFFFRRAQDALGQSRPLGQSKRRSRRRKP